ncbi:MAG: LysR substrate-binding domain-containing protein [Desulfovibrionaceae bacterium]|jgi:LysR family glycine cleavage system transcriptional activator|nr:LysR substrate-binding domain-containing protein [Desulfovibrionaceae bacterium]
MNQTRRRLPSLQALRAFDAAARRLHFTLAAQELSVTPGAVSRQIQALEAELGIRLFDRYRRQVTLTPEGQAYAKEVARVLDDLEWATNRARAWPRVRPLSICAYPSFAMRWLIPRWRRFQEMNPAIELQLTTSLAVVDVVRDGFDAVVRFLEKGPSGDNSVELVRTEIFPVCSPALQGDLRKPDDLRQQVLIESASRPHDWRRWFHAAGLTVQDEKTGYLRFESLSLAYQAAIEGMGVAMGIGCLVEDDLQMKRLVRPLKLIHPVPGAFHLLYAPNRRSDPRLVALLDFLRSEAQA